MSSSTSLSLLLVLLALSAGAQGSRSPASPPAPSLAYPGFDERYGIVPGTDLKTLVGRPSLIAMSAERYRDPETGERRLRGFGEAHGVYDIDLGQLRAVLDDPAGATSYAPRLLEARVEEAEGPRIVLYQEVGISFLGFRLSYRFRAEQLRDELGPGEVGYRIRLLESLDGNFFEAYTSWYAKEVLVEGRRLVYLRYYTRPGLRRTVIGLELIMKSFTPGELKGTLDRVAKEARRPAAAM
jgi:hypothetical protein